jgi:cytochrome P450
MEVTASRWRDGAVVDLASEMLDAARRITVRMLFDISDEQKLTVLSGAVEARREYMEFLFRAVIPFPEIVPCRTTFRYRRAAAILDEAIYDGIRRARSSGAQQSTLLSLMANEKYGSEMSDREIRDEALTLSLASYETTGVSLAWTWYLLDQYREKALLLEEEVEKVLGKRRPTSSDVPGLSYADMIWAESLRLYPPTWLFVRVATRADTLPSGIRIPAGAKIYLCQYTAHRNPHYFPSPDLFEPERFSSAEKKKRPAFAYFPFGGGPRTCIGLSLARMEAVLSIATLARRFRFTLIPNQHIVPEAGVTLRPKYGMRVRVSCR